MSIIKRLMICMKIIGIYFEGQRENIGPGLRSRYSRTVRGSDSGGWRDFPYPSIPPLGPTQPPIQRVTGLFLGGKAAGA
jgi:hypothetical protein